jgi:putative FmdB family regulatory protein
MIMPIYEYKCKDCNKEFELLTTSAKDHQNIQCPACKSTNVTKLISAGAPLSAIGIPLASSGSGGNSRFS